jgi:hypothetical protein
MHKCDKCGKEFKYSSILQRHISKKFSCNNSLNIINSYDKKINEIDIEIKIKIIKSKETGNKCLFCNHIFNQKSSLTRHINTYCDIKKNLYIKKESIMNEKNKLLEEIKKKEELTEKNNEIETLKDMVKQLLYDKSKNNNINNINNINNKIINNNGIINNNNVVVNINSYGKEDLSHITINDYKKYFTGFFPGFIKFIEKIHFDENMPANHNICITNMKSKYMYIYDDKWISKERKETIDSFIAKKYNTYVNKLDELEESKQIDDKILEKFNAFAKNYQDIDAQKHTKNDIMLMIYNNRNKIKMK